MSRPRKTKADVEAEAKAAFQKEIRVRRAELDMSQNALAAEVGIVPSFMSNLLNSPDKLTAARIRAIVQVLDPNPLIVLEFLGYSRKDIQRLVDN